MLQHNFCDVFSRLIESMWALTNCSVFVDNDCVDVNQSFRFQYNSGFYEYTSVKRGPECAIATKDYSRTCYLIIVESVSSIFGYDKVASPKVKYKDNLEKSVCSQKRESNTVL